MLKTGNGPPVRPFRLFACPPRRHTTLWRVPIPIGRRSVLASWASSQGVIAEANELLNTLEGAGARLRVKNKRGGPSVNPPVGSDPESPA